MKPSFNALKLTETEESTVRTFFKQVLNNKVILDDINRIESKSMFKRILDCLNDITRIKELKGGICKPFLVMDSCGLIKIKYKSSTDKNVLLNKQDTILLSYLDYDSWYDNNLDAINDFLELHENSDFKIFELIAIFFIKTLDLS